MSGAPRLAADVLDGLRSRPGRTAIAFAGVAVGLFALTLTLGVLNGFRQRAQRLTAELGVHAAVLLQTPDAGSRDPSRGLRRRHLETLRAAAPDATWSGLQAGPVAGPGGHGALWLVRTDGSLAAARTWSMTGGRFLDAADVRDGAAYATATESAMRAFGWRPGDSVSLAGHILRLVGTVGGGTAGEPVTGVLSPAASAVFVPWTAIPSREGPGADDRLDAIHLGARDETSLRAALSAAGRVLAAPDLALEAATWVTPDTLLRGLRRWRTGVAWGTGVLAGLCLLLGGSSLMGLLLSDVRNRLPEIGLRISLGARPPDIAALFLGEALLVTVAGAAAALLAAWPALRLLSAQTAVPFDLDLLSVLAVLAAALLFGAAFSYVPARLASRTSASEALRNE
ncbi:MAG: ABC transporter permease [Verrucomicrobia bacterium]|nr:ABC transporter permease [Verrucomicrobiota bacterium]